ncbi:ribokinase [Nannizzia gypsea CBS 118893]|uniref:Ribokinase n=1 Tax=Arthroderma gypseum (strain ATCC MYA-4604 / CBS 118893) TaxID=535722 RepID=E4UUE9_ARTGP|nr:ribokinase [Nannizzia gypsea CBS 118893]EFR00916.1 ribokinase [Nannizzia gypsea CBS 118893]
MAPSIRVIGSLNVDMVSVTPRFPGPGETLTATSFTTSPGGKGANQAVACGRLSRSRPSSSSPSDVLANVEMVGAVGRLDAHFSTLLQPTLSSSGVSTERVRTIDDEHTGVAVIIVDTSAAGENRILFSPNANYTGMKPTDEVIQQSLSTPLPDIIVLQAEIPIDTVIGILRGVAAKRKLQKGDVEVVFNPAPAPEGGLPDDVYASVDHLIMNETECELMAPKELRDNSLTQEDRRNKIAIHFHALGVRYVIVTLGAKGVWYSAAEPGKAAQQDMGKWLRSVNEVPASKVEKVVDTTAAGDTFVGGYSVQIAQWREQRRATGKTCLGLEVDEWKDRHGKVTEEAVRWGTRASAKCVQQSGAMDSIPFRDEI